MSLQTDFERVQLPLEHAFTISRGTTEVAENVVVTITDGDGTTGVGGAAPSSYYGESASTVEAVLPDLLDIVESVGDPFARERIERRLEAEMGKNAAARCAIDIALADLAAKRLDVPLYRQWGLDPADAPTSSFTIGLDDLDTMEAKTREAVDAGYSVLKVKLGTDRDREILETVRGAAPEARIRVDANAAWTPKHATRMTDTLADTDVEFLEQPVAASDIDGLRFVRENGRLPVAADESAVVTSDIPKVADAVDIVNAKLMKCGSLLEARRFAHTAHAHDLEAMLGCMIESNAAIAAGCQLSPLFEYVDLDGSLLLDSDPYDGVPMPAGDIDLAACERPGTGAVKTGE